MKNFSLRQNRILRILCRTFAILAEWGAYHRIVSGYYGGTYNQIGNFYTFKQQDAHSWLKYNKG